MANLNGKPLFVDPIAVETYLSIATAMIKSMRTGQIEPVRHLLEVRLQEFEDRERMIRFLQRQINFLRLGSGKTFRSDASKGVLIEVPVGYHQEKIKDKFVIKKIIEPKTAFADKKTVPLKLSGPVGVNSSKQTVNVAAALESMSTASDCSVSRLSEKLPPLLRGSIPEVAKEQTLVLLGHVLGKSPQSDSVRNSYAELHSSATYIADGIGENQSFESIGAVTLATLKVAQTILHRVVKAQESGSKPVIAFSEEYPKIWAALVALHDLLEDRKP